VRVKAALNIGELKCVRTFGGKTTAQCPACAEQGKDKSGEHLFINSDGKFGCVLFPRAEGEAHRKRIFELAGKRDGNKRRNCVSRHMLRKHSTAKPKTTTHKTGKIHETIQEAECALLWGLEKKHGITWKRTHTAIYCDSDGNEVAAVIRFDHASGKKGEDGRAIKTFRPLHSVKTGWRIGDPPGKWPLYRLRENLTIGGTVYIHEGERKAESAAADGLPSVASAHGAKSPGMTDWTPLKGRDVCILPDNDDSGREYAQTVASLVTEAGARSVKIVTLPDLPPKGDYIEFKAARRGMAPTDIRAEIEALVARAEVWSPAARNTSKGKPPMIPLPCSRQTITEAGAAFGALLAENQSHYLRGGAIVKIKRDKDGLPVLDEVKLATLASDFESVAQPSRILVKKIEGKDVEEEIPAVCTEQMAKMIAHADAFRCQLKRINIIARCPVLIERDGQITEIVGYDPESGIYAAGEPTKHVSLDKAREMLLGILDGFRFATPADEARALAAIITPALVFSGLLKGRAPIDLGEAGDSQSGKGYRNKLTASIYRHTVRAITQKRGGVGSLVESFDMALICGANFISFDNVRGKLDSQAVESFLTEDYYTARAPYRQPVDIDPSRVVVMMTSNKAEMTNDLVNRTSCVRILKQPDDFVFKSYPEGDALDHVRARQSAYLGAVHSVIRAWYEAGQPRTTETRHDFRRWVQTLDWICQNLLCCGPIMDGHRETQHRMANPAMNWLRDVSLEVKRASKFSQLLRAAELLDLLEDTGHLPPGMPENADLSNADTRKAALQAIGRKMASCFRSGDTVTLDSIVIERRTKYDQETRRDIKLYRFEPSIIDSAPIGANQPQHDPHGGDNENAPGKNKPKSDDCSYKYSCGAPDDAPIQSLNAPNALEGKLYGEHSSSFRTIMQRNVILL
jgi:hypothetical protein